MSDTNRVLAPTYIYETYIKLYKCNLIKDKILNDRNIDEFQKILNNSIPQNENDNRLRLFIRYLYLKNPNSFYKFLIHSKMTHLILWTDVRCILKHFGIQHILYIKYTDKFECYYNKYVEKYRGDDYLYNNTDYKDIISKHNNTPINTFIKSQLEFPPLINE